MSSLATTDMYCSGKKRKQIQQQETRQQPQQHHCLELLPPVNVERIADTNDNKQQKIKQQSRYSKYNVAAILTTNKQTARQQPLQNYQTYQTVVVDGFDTTTTSRTVLRLLQRAMNKKHCKVNKRCSLLVSVVPRRRMMLKNQLFVLSFIWIFLVWNSRSMVVTSLHVLSLSSSSLSYSIVLGRQQQKRSIVTTTRTYRAFKLCQQQQNGNTDMEETNNSNINDSNNVSKNKSNNDSMKENHHQNDSLFQMGGGSKSGMPTSFSFGESVRLQDRPSTSAGTELFSSTSFVPSSSSSMPSSLTQEGKNNAVDSVADVKDPTISFVQQKQQPVEEKCLVTEERNVANTMKTRNMSVAIMSILLPIVGYVYQYLNPIQPIQLLVQMSQSSEPVTVIGRNTKPTVVEFWAPWCENCKLVAPTIYMMEQEYKDSINFISINGDDMNNYPIVEAFGVDAIPHIALLSSDGTVQTALIGPIPKTILQADLNALLAMEEERLLLEQQPSEATTTTTTPIITKTQLPYQMLDVFANKPLNERRIRFDIVEPNEIGN